MLEVFAATPGLVNAAEPVMADESRPEGFARRPAYRPQTKFETRGLRLGHGVWDVVFRKVSAGAGRVARRGDARRHDDWFSLTAGPVQSNGR
jgi:hypothetical protein